MDQVEAFDENFGKGKIICPVCAGDELDNPGDICSECGWEFDRMQYADHEDADGANILNVNESILEYVLLNSADAEVGDEVRKARYEFDDIVSVIMNKCSQGAVQEDEFNAGEIKKARQTYMDRLNALLRKCIVKR